MKKKKIVNRCRERKKKHTHTQHNTLNYLTVTSLYYIEKLFTSINQNKKKKTNPISMLI